MTCERVSLLAPHSRPAQLYLHGGPPPLLGFGSSTISSSSLSTDFLDCFFSGSSSSSSVTSSSAPCYLENVRVVDREGGVADAFEEGPALLLVDVLRAPTAFSFSSTSSAPMRFRFVGLDSGSMLAQNETTCKEGFFTCIKPQARNVMLA